MIGYGHSVGPFAERMASVLYIPVVLLDGVCQDGGVKDGMVLNFGRSTTKWCMRGTYLIGEYVYEERQNYYH